MWGAIGPVHMWAENLSYCRERVIHVMFIQFMLSQKHYMMSVNCNMPYYWCLLFVSERRLWTFRKTTSTSWDTNPLLPWWPLEQSHSYEILRHLIQETLWDISFRRHCEGSHSAVMLWEILFRWDTVGRFIQDTLRRLIQMRHCETSLWEKTLWDVSFRWDIVWRIIQMRHCDILFRWDNI